MTKDLHDKAIDIKGKKYVLVSDRVLYFNEAYPNGSIATELLTDEDKVTFRAVVTPDCSSPERRFIGHSQATWGDGYINKTSALENAETSAVGRALAMMGIGVIDSIASVDEINKAQTQPAYSPLPQGVAAITSSGYAVKENPTMQKLSPRELCILAANQVIEDPRDLPSVESMIENVRTTDKLTAEDKDLLLPQLTTILDEMQEGVWKPKKKGVAKL